MEKMENKETWKYKKLKEQQTFKIVYGHFYDYLSENASRLLH